MASHLDTEAMTPNNDDCSPCNKRLLIIGLLRACAIGKLLNRPLNKMCFSAKNCSTVILPCNRGWVADATQTTSSSRIFCRENIFKSEKEFDSFKDFDEDFAEEHDEDFGENLDEGFGEEFSEDFGEEFGGDFGEDFDKSNDSEY